MQFLQWVNADQARYLTIAEGTLLLFVAIVIAAAFMPRLGAALSSRRGVVAFLFMVFLVLLAARWPTLFVRQMPGDHDEAQVLAEAHTALYSPIPWLGFDPQTEGPLNASLLMVPAALGVHLTYFTLRAIALLLEFGALAALYVAAALCFDAGIAQLAVIPPLVFWTVAQQEAFVHFSNAQSSIFLGALMVALISWGWRRGFTPVLAFAIGAAGGMLPFDKLQSVPIDAALLTVAAAVLFASPGLPLRTQMARLGLLLCGLLFFPFVVIETVAFGGAFGDFWRSYILAALAYIVPAEVPATFLTTTAEFGPFFDWLVALTLAGGLVVALRSSRLPPRLRYAYGAALVILVGAIDAIYSPHRDIKNYLLLAVIPAAAAAAAGLAAITWLVAKNSLVGPKRGALAVVFIATCLLVQHAVPRAPYAWIGPDLDAYMRGATMDPMSAAIAQNLKPDERLAIWGYRAEYWVYTSTLMGTRDPNSFFQFTPYFNPNRDYYRQRYVEDFRENRPEGFLDAGPDSFDVDGSTHDAYESVPGLAELVHRDYVLKARWKRSRFFLRRDLARVAGGSR
jgi:uncharacterized membrane protein